MPNSREAERQRERCTEVAENHRLQADDLVQQTRSANAAEAQVDLSYNLAWMGLYGTIGGFLTLIAAAAAAFYARDAARAANDSLAHAKEASEAELRPWLQIDVTGDTYRLTETQATVAYSLIVRNIGKLPARVVFSEARLFNFGPEQEIRIPEFFESEFAPWRGSRARTVLPQGEADLSSLATLPRDEVDINETEGTLLVHPVLAIRVVYRWGEGQYGQTCQAFGVARVRTEANPTWRPIQLRTDKDTYTSISIKPNRLTAFAKPAASTGAPRNPLITRAPELHPGLSSHG